MSKLRKIRKDLGMKQKEFAERLGLTQSALSQLESGKRGKITELHVLAAEKIAAELREASAA